MLKICITHLYSVFPGILDDSNWTIFLVSQPWSTFFDKLLAPLEFLLCIGVWYGIAEPTIVKKIISKLFLYFEWSEMWMEHWYSQS